MVSKEELFKKLKKRVINQLLPRHLAAIHRLEEMCERDVNTISEKEFCFFLGVAYCFDILEREKILEFIKS